MAVINTACSSCTKRDVCRHIDDVERMKNRIKNENIGNEAIEIDIKCSHCVRIIEPILFRR